MSGSTYILAATSVVAQSNQPTLASTECSWQSQGQFNLHFPCRAQNMNHCHWLMDLTVHFESSVLPPPKLQALVYDILPSTTAVFSYVIGSRKLSANERQFFHCWHWLKHWVVSYTETTQKQGVPFIASNKVYTSTNKTTIVWIEMELFFLYFYPGWMRLMFTCELWR